MVHMRNATRAPCAQQQARTNVFPDRQPVQSGTVLRCPALLLASMSHAAVQPNIDELISTHVRLGALQPCALLPLLLCDMRFRAAASLLRAGDARPVL